MPRHPRTVCRPQRRFLVGQEGRHITFAMGLIVTLSLMSVGCSSDGDGSGKHSMMRDGESNAAVQKGAREIAITGTSFAFAPKVIRLTAKERATLVLTSNDAEHDVTVEGAPGVGHVVHASADTTERGGLEISKPGTYVFYCSVSGHRKAGMVGRIVVSP